VEPVKWRVRFMLIDDFHDYGPPGTLWKGTLTMPSKAKAEEYLDRSFSDSWLTWIESA
jgi:hypothetical protein